MPATPEASWFQNDFSGGEISPDYQGNFDDPLYSKSLALCRNNLVIPGKSVERRGGSRIAGRVASGTSNYYKLFSLVANNGTPIIAEFSELTYAASSGGYGGLYLWAPPSNLGAVLPGFANDVMRMPFAPVCDVYMGVTSIDNSSPAVFTLASTPSTPWSTGDRVTVYVDDANPATCGIIRARTFLVTMLTATTLTLSGLSQDGIAVNGSALVNRTTFSHIYIGHHLHFLHPTIDDYIPYGAPTGQQSTIPQDDIAAMRVVQTADDRAFFFIPHVMPWVLDFSVPAAPTFNDAAWNWVDGPWEDPPVGSSQTGNFPLTIVANTGATIQLSYDGVHTIPEIRGIGQGIRLWTQPALYDSGTAYTSGQTVSYNDEFYQATASSTGVVPGTADPTGIFPWVLDPTLGTWSNGFHVATDGSNNMTFQITSDQQVPTYDPPNKIETYQAAFFFTGYSASGNLPRDATFAGRGPSCACWHEGRIWMGGAGADYLATYPSTLGSPTQFGFNRFDASVANNTVTVGGSIPTRGTSVPVVTVPQFSPTDNNGNVLDDSGISYTLNSDTAESLHWFQPDALGILVGTNTSEWMISASSLSDPLTPTSIQAHRQTRFGSQDSAPVLPGLSVLFVQQAGVDCLEYVADVLSQRFTGRVLNERARHMSGNNSVTYRPDDNIKLWTRAGIKELAYQKQPYPYVWAAMNDGTLASCLYQRLSRFGQEPPTLNAWCSHVIANNNTGATGGGNAALTDRFVQTITSTNSIPFTSIPICSMKAAQALLPGDNLTFPYLIRQRRQRRPDGVVDQPRRPKPAFRPRPIS